MSKNLANAAITHVFVLMLENRSLDHMLGFSQLAGTDAATGKPTTINGLTGKESNQYKGVSYPVTAPADYIMPFDPGHEFTDVLEQLCGAGSSYPFGGKYPSINNSGFVSNYATTQSAGEGGATSNFGEIMKCYDSVTQLPVMTTLAQQFAVCDSWFSALPGPTWPNRFFVHAASSGGLDHSPRTIEIAEWETIKGFKFPNGSVYQLMDDYSNTNNGWRLYRGVNEPLTGTIPNVAALKGIHLWDTHEYENFASDINGEYPYSYTFIEPNYGDVINNSYAGGQSQHPMDDVRNGEALIKSTYEAIRNSPLWPNSLLLVTYDEHGGFYDHVPPTAAIAPGDTQPGSKYNQYGFTFEQYGVRVPAIVVSAYTPKNIIDHRPYDHSSVPATLEALFNLPPLTNRDAKANNITSLAALPAARTDTPTTLPNPPAISEKEIAAARSSQALHTDDEPADGGNLPGFLHIALKAEMELAEADEHKIFIMENFSAIKTRGQARQYLENMLPKLFNANLAT